MQQKQGLTTLNTWAAAIHRTLALLGQDADVAFEQAGLDRSLLQVADARYPVSGMTRLWRVAARMSGNAAIGLKVAEQIRPGDLHALGLSILTSETLDDAMRRFVSYSRTITDAVEVNFVRKNGLVRISLRSQGGDTSVAFEALEAALASIVKMWRLIISDTHDGVNPLKVELMRPQPKKASPWEKFFTAPVVFGAPLHCLYYPAEVLDTPLPGANPRLAVLNEHAARRYLNTLEQDPFTTQVCSLIIARLPRGRVHGQEIAHALNINPRTLQRRLKREDTNFHTLLENTRREMAGGYMLRADLSLSDISFLLGFSDQGNFSRCFKRWYGCTPRQYRAAIAKTS